MVIISTPLSTIPAAAGVAGIAAAGLKALLVRLPAAGMVSLTMAGAVAGTAAAMREAAMPVVVIGSPENREAHRQQIGVVLHQIVVDPHPTAGGPHLIVAAPRQTAGEDSVKVILTV
jgi:hypothetical protein